MKVKQFLTFSWPLSTYYNRLSHYLSFYTLRPVTLWGRCYLSILHLSSSGFPTLQQSDQYTVSIHCVPYQTLTLWLVNWFPLSVTCSNSHQNVYVCSALNICLPQKSCWNIIATVAVWRVGTPRMELNFTLLSEFVLLWKDRLDHL